MTDYRFPEARALDLSLRVAKAGGLSDQELVAQLRQIVDLTGRRDIEALLIEAARRIERYSEREAGRY